MQGIKLILLLCIYRALLLPALSKRHRTVRCKLSTHPTPLPILFPYLTPLLAPISPLFFSFIHNVLLQTLSSFRPLPSPPPHFPLSILSRSGQHVPPKTPLYLTMDHTQRSAPANHITRTSANMTSRTRPHNKIYTSTKHLRTSLENSPSKERAPLQNTSSAEIKRILILALTLVQHNQKIKIWS